MKEVHCEWTDHLDRRAQDVKVDILVRHPIEGSHVVISTSHNFDTSEVETIGISGEAIEKIAKLLRAL